MLGTGRGAIALAARTAAAAAAGGGARAAEPLWQLETQPREGLAISLTYETVQLSAGTYPLPVHFGGTALAVSAASDLTIAGVGDETLLVLGDIANLLTVSGGANITLSSFAVDSARVPFTLAYSTSDTPAGTLLEFDATGLYAMDFARYPWLGHAQSILGYDAARGRPSAPPNVTDIYALDAPIALTYLSSTGPAAVLRLEGRHIQVGQWHILRHQVYSFNAFSFYGTRGLAIVNVSLFSMAGMGLYTDSVTGVLVDGLSIRKLPSRPMSITADGIHCSNTRGGTVLIQNSLLEGQGDDGMNIPTIFQQIGALSGSGLDFQVQARSQPCPARPLFAAGDTVNFFNISSMAPLGQGVVASVGGNFTVTLAAPAPPGVALYTLVNSAAQYADSVVVRNTTFRNNRARGALLKSSNVLATGNTFEGCSLPAAKTETDGCYWFEGHPVTNWSFVNNTVREVNYWSPGSAGDVEIDNAVPKMSGGVPNPQACYAWTDPASFVQHSLNISFNTFTSPWGGALALVQSTDGVTITGNAAARAGASALTFDFVGQGTAHSSVHGNTCDGVPCTQTGFY